MDGQTVLVLVGAALLVAAIVYFQYFYKRQNKTQRTWLLAILRFVTLYTIAVLLINPKAKLQTSFIEKAKLNVVVDESSSVLHLEQAEVVKDLVQKLRSNKEVQNRFEVQEYAFSSALSDSVMFKFAGTQTEIAKNLQELNQITKGSIAPVVLLTDGNQTIGTDYQFIGTNLNQAVYPLIIGDTTRFRDVKIQQLNANKFAYLNNNFPVEAVVSYSGKEDVSSLFTITQNAKIVYRKEVKLTSKQSVQVLNFTLPAKSPGIKAYSANIQALEKEKNIVNNTRQFAVEVIDQKSNILLVSTIVHPDIGAIKRSIESNERSQVKIVTPGENMDLDSYQLVILYQPDASFRTILEKLEQAGKNFMTITGIHTNWNILNQLQKDFTFQTSGQVETILPELNTTFTSFLTDDIDVTSFPPLEGLFGNLAMNASHQVLLYQKIGTIVTKSPLLATMTSEKRRQAVLFGEGIWKWRAASYANTKNFDLFDNFFSKLIQYLSSDKSRNRLNVDSEAFYYGTSGALITATYLTKNYEFDPRATLDIILTNTETDNSRTVPLILYNSNYQVDLSNLPPGKYAYTVRVKGEKLSKSGIFTILEFDIEKQFLNPDVVRLQKLANDTGGVHFFDTQVDALVQQLLADKRYQPVQKNIENVVSLITWKYLLGLLILTLGIEWFTRKYFGLI